MNVDRAVGGWEEKFNTAIQLGHVLVRCQRYAGLPDTSDPGHFGPETFRTQVRSVPRHFGPATEVSGYNEPDVMGYDNDGQ